MRLIDVGSLPYCKGCKYDSKWDYPTKKERAAILGEMLRNGRHSTTSYKKETKQKERKPMVTIKKVIFNDPVTIVIWSDKTKTIVRTQGYDIYDPEKGLAMAISKKMLGDNKGNYYNEFKKWLPEEKVIDLTDKSSLYPVRPIKFNLDTSKFRNYVGRRAAALGEKQDGEK